MGRKLPPLITKTLKEAGYDWRAIGEIASINSNVPPSRT